MLLLGFLTELLNHSWILVTEIKYSKIRHIQLVASICNYLRHALMLKHIEGFFGFQSVQVLRARVTVFGLWGSRKHGISSSDMWLTSPSRKSCILTTATTIETRENAPKHITWNSKHKTWTLWLFQWGMLRTFPQCMICPEFTEKVSQTMHCGILLNMPYWKNPM